MASAASRAAPRNRQMPLQSRPPMTRVEARDVLRAAAAPKETDAGAVAQKDNAGSELAVGDAPALPRLSQSTLSGGGSCGASAVPSVLGDDTASLTSFARSGILVGSPLFHRFTDVGLPQWGS